jgi:hypothetical protein
MASEPYFRSRGLSQSAQRAQVLLERYPDIGERDLATLIRTFANLPLLDFGLLAADERMGDKLEQFYADHGDKLRPSLTLWAVAVPVAVVAIALAWLALG